MQKKYYFLTNLVFFPKNEQYLVDRPLAEIIALKNKKLIVLKFTKKKFCYCKIDFKLLLFCFTINLFFIFLSFSNNNKISSNFAHLSLVFSYFWQCSKMHQICYISRFFFFWTFLFSSFSLQMIITKKIIM